MAQGLSCSMAFGIFPDQGLNPCPLHWQANLFLFLFFFFVFHIKLLIYIFLYSRFLSVINFIHISVYMSLPIAQFITPPPRPPSGFPPLVSICLFSTSVSQLLPCKLAHLYHFSRFHIHALTYDMASKKQQQKNGHEEQIGRAHV